MNHALILNLAIIGLIATALFVTGNPLVLLGIVFLKDVPYGLMVGRAEGQESDDSSGGNPIGFIGRGKDD